MNKEDFYWLNEDSRTFLERGYLHENIYPVERVSKIADRVEELLGINGIADKIFNYTAKGFYSFSSPVWANFGERRGLPVSCFSSFIPDDMSGILSKISEVGIMTKMGGGTSGYFGDIRPRGSSISVGGQADGPVRFMELFDKVTSVVSQSNVRRGSFAAYLPVEHPDILEFLKIKDIGHPIQEMSFGTTITDKWMEEMISGDKEKRKVWANIIKKRYESGYPYVVFIDNVNKANPQVYKDKGLEVVSQNLCVTGDQRVPSNFGILTAKELYEIGEELILFDNNKKVKSSPMKLIEKNAEVYKVTLSNGMSHTITSYHKIKTSEYDGNGKYGREKIVIKECKDLKIGDRAAIQTNKGLFGNKDMPKEAFLLGLYQADGTQHKDLIMFDLWENDFDLKDRVQEYHDYICEKYNTQIRENTNRKYPKPQFHNCSIPQGDVKKISLRSKACKKALNFEKGYIPDWIWESNERTQWEYLKGLYYADGTVNISDSNGNPLYLSITSIYKEFLKELQILMANLGLQSSLHIQREAGKQLLPDGNGGYKYYNTKDSWRLIIGNKNDAIEFNKNTGFLDRKNVKLENKEYRDNTKKYSKIISIEYVGKEDVYCCAVDSEEHLWSCNGFITHNCAEICLSSSPEESFVCVLSSLNLLHWEEIIQTDAIETMIYLLDAVNEEFVLKTENMPHMEAPNRFAKRHRALGMGVLGWHSFLQSKNIAFESMEAKHWNNVIFKTIRERTDKATEKLASIFGEPEVLKGYGRRNTHTMAIAPTTSSAFILGQISPSIEPLNSNYFVKKLAKGNFTYKNPFLKDVLQKYNQDTDDIWKSILIKGGSVQHLSFLSRQEKDTYKTFGEISQKEIIIQAAQRQKYIDQGQSLNIMVPPKTPAKETSQLMIEAWKLGVKSLYYQRSANPAQELARSLTECKSCEG